MFKGLLRKRQVFSFIHYYHSKEETTFGKILLYYIKKVYFNSKRTLFYYQSQGESVTVNLFIYLGKPKV